jgi:hypothetical protein
MSNKKKVFKKCDKLFGEFEWEIQIHRSLNDGGIIYYINNDQNEEVAYGDSFKDLLSSLKYRHEYNNSGVSDEEMNGFFVNTFITEGRVFTDQNDIIGLIKIEIQKKLAEGDWDALDYLVIKKENCCVCLSLDNEKSSVPDGLYFYDTISNKEYDKAMQEIQNKLEAELERIKKSKLPF